MNRDTDLGLTSNEALKAQVLELQQKLDQQSQFINQLLEQIRLARHQHFGVRSERYSLDQLALVLMKPKSPPKIIVPKATNLLPRLTVSLSRLT